MSALSPIIIRLGSLRVVAASRPMTSPVNSVMLFFVFLSARDLLPVHAIAQEPVSVVLMIAAPASRVPGVLSTSSRRRGRISRRRVGWMLVLVRLLLGSAEMQLEAWPLLACRVVLDWRVCAIRP